MVLDWIIYLLVLLLGRNLSLPEKTSLSVILFGEVSLKFLGFQEAYATHLICLGCVAVLVLQDVFNKNVNIERGVIYVLSSLLCFYEILFLLSPLSLPYVFSFTLEIQGYVKETLLIMFFSRSFYSLKDFTSPLITSDWRINTINLAIFLKCLYLWDFTKLF